MQLEKFYRLLKCKLMPFSITFAFSFSYYQVYIFDGRAMMNWLNSTQTEVKWNEIKESYACLQNISAAILTEKEFVSCFSWTRINCFFFVHFSVEYDFVNVSVIINFDFLLFFSLLFFSKSLFIIWKHQNTQRVFPPESTPTWWMVMIKHFGFYYFSLWF